MNTFITPNDHLYIFETLRETKIELDREQDLELYNPNKRSVEEEEEEITLVKRKRVREDEDDALLDKNILPSVVYDVVSRDN
jgi:hypothetical protein